MNAEFSLRTTRFPLIADGKIECKIDGEQKKNHEDGSPNGYRWELSFAPRILLPPDHQRRMLFHTLSQPKKPVDHEFQLSLLARQRLCRVVTERDEESHYVHGPTVDIFCEGHQGFLTEPYYLPSRHPIEPIEVKADGGFAVEHLSEQPKCDKGEKKEL